jgi:aspartate carbamoyltransferase catalytic subunit
MHHLLGLEGLSAEQINAYLDNAKSFVEVGSRELKKVPTLRGKTIINLFMEPSTRTRSSFEIAGKRLSADVINISGSESSAKKGETLLDTARTLEAMAPDVLVVRHKESGAAHFLARHLKHTSIVNAGDGTHEHPTQGLLDCLTLQQHFTAKGTTLSGKTIAIVGDIRHSRVARSNVYALTTLGNTVHLIGPPSLLGEEFTSNDCFGPLVSAGKVKRFTEITAGITGADVIMVLRMQMERQESHFVPSLQEYTDAYCITEQRITQYAPQAVVLHPGPMNRGIEIATDVADGPRSLVTTQVANGLAVRMAVLFVHAVQGGKHD